VRAIATGLIVLAAIVNLAPVIGVLSAQRLQSMYGMAIADPNLALLLRHRAVLFAIVGGLLLASAVHPPLRLAGIAAGLLSMGSFIVLALLVGDVNPSLRRVVVIDAVASLGLIVALLLERWSR
jgi:hypothetical protein